ncbi:MAG: hypothetical protein H7Z21_02660 [Hymenobacter sp.]|nr:hypothetical protein [Hymenobacter sp.]
MVAFGNFDVVAAPATITFPQTGTWYNYLTGAQLAATSTSVTMPLQPGEYAVYTSTRIAPPVGTPLATRSRAAAVFKLTLTPNPAAGAASISYELPTVATATVTVQNLLGQTVRQLAPARQS